MVNFMSISTTVEKEKNLFPYQNLHLFVCFLNTYTGIGTSQGGHGNAV